MSSVTYSPEDNKLRLYVGRVPRDEYETLRAAGFTSTPKQGCDFVAVWTPAREDLASEYLDDDEDIGDEDYSPEERAADKAERFSGYRDKRADEAGAAADTFEQGPQAFGSQSQARAERQARRHDRHRVYSVSQWSKAEYWQYRTAGVISHALHRASPSVRRGRILTLEAEQRKHEKSRQEYAETYARWCQVADLDGADQPLTFTEDGYGSEFPAVKLAYTLANHSHGYDYHHPRTGRTSSLYSLLTDRADPITAAECAALWLDGLVEPSNPDSHSARWSAHYALRLEYERAMLANEGGMVAESEMEPGGWIKTSSRTGSVFTDVAAGWKQIHRVNKSPATHRVTSVRVMGLVGYRDPKPGLVSVNIERLGESCYRPPTDEERQAFAVATKAAKAEAKATKPKTPSLINPTLEDAQQLQALWNASARAKHEKQHGKNCKYNTFEDADVMELTQGLYSANSGGSYSHCETRTLFEDGRLSRRESNLWTSEGAAYDRSLPAFACKVRIRTASGWYAAPRVIVITDKPQKPLPIDWDTLTGPEATPAELVEA